MYSFFFFGPIFAHWCRNDVAPDDLLVLSLDRSEWNVAGIELSLIAKAGWTRRAPRPSSHPFSTNHQWKTWRVFFPRYITGESRLLAPREPSWRLRRLNKHFCTNTHSGRWCGFVVMMSLEGAEPFPRCLVVLWHVTAVSRHSYLSVRAQAGVQMWCERVHTDFKASKSWSRWSELTSQPCTFFSDREPWPLLYQMIRFQNSFKEKRLSWQNNLSAVVYSFKIK